MATSQKVVLVQYKERTKKIKFTSSTEDNDLPHLKDAVLQAYSGILSVGQSNMVFQIQSKEWNGVFIDVLDGGIPNCSVLRLLLEPEPFVIDEVNS